MASELEQKEMERMRRVKLKSSERTKDNFVYTTTGFYLTTTDSNRSRIYIRQRFFILQQRFIGHLLLVCNSRNKIDFKVGDSKIDFEVDKIDIEVDFSKIDFITTVVI